MTHPADPSTFVRSPEEFLDLFRADPTNAPLALYAGACLDAHGRHDEALCVWTLGDDANPALRTVRNHAEATAEMRAHSARANDAICAHFNGMHRDELARAKAESGTDLPHLENAIWTHYAQDEWTYDPPERRSIILHCPDIPATPVFDAASLDWAKALSAKTDIIREEILAVDRDDKRLVPYVPEGTPAPEWGTLKGQRDWSSLYLHFNAQETPHTHDFPETLKALSDIRLVEKDGVPMETFFSLLRPGAKIPPHHGLTNSRLTVHLPLVVPDKCHIRVGDKMHIWQEGEVFAFDDSFRHEAFNGSDRDRIVLIFEVPHPALSAVEADTIERVFERFDKWVAARAERIGLGQPAR